MSRQIASAEAGIFAALKDDALFNQVCIELGALTWPYGADLDPEWVHEEIGKNKTWFPISSISSLKNGKPLRNLIHGI